MPFFSNHLTLTHEASGVVIRFDPRDALRACSHDADATIKEPPPHAHGQQKQPEHAHGAGAGVQTAAPFNPNSVATRAPFAAAPGSVAGVHPGVASLHPGAASRSVPAGVAPGRIQVRAATKWDAKKKTYEELVEGGVKQIDYKFDWTYTTTYKGTIEKKTTGVTEQAAAPASAPAPSSNSSVNSLVSPTSEEIPVSMLQRPDPILWYDTLPLFEDELHDNGISQLVVKVRVMDACMLVLMQFWLRVDDILMRVYDTRWFHQFGTKKAIREQTRRENTFDELQQVRRGTQQARAPLDHQHLF
jgi:hypothetical protein